MAVNLEFIAFWRVSWKWLAEDWTVHYGNNAVLPILPSAILARYLQLDSTGKSPLRLEGRLLPCFVFDF